MQNTFTHKTFFVSDLHLYDNSIRLIARDDIFSSTEEMNKRIIENWNETVSNEDTVYYLGDLFRKDSKNAVEIISMLNGKKTLILGNHDSKWYVEKTMKELFVDVAQSMDIEIGDKTFHLSHLPEISYIRPADYHIFGHIHNFKWIREYSEIRKRKTFLNCCCEITDYRPVELDELIAMNDLLNVDKLYMSCPYN